MPLVHYSLIHPHIAQITLNDPDRLNAMTGEMGDEFQAMVETLKAQSDVRAVIITGEGRAFSSGGNLTFIKENYARDPKKNERLMVVFYKKFLSLLELPMSTLALINGPAVGAGLAIALACDVRFATEGAKMGVNFTKIGLTPGMGSSFFLPRVVGKSRAFELFASGRLVMGTEAKAIGLVHEIYATGDELKAAGLAWAQTVAENAPLALQGTKRLLNRDLDGLDLALDLEAKAQAIVFATQDIREGVAAIEGKRAAAFKGV